MLPWMRTETEVLLRYLNKMRNAVVNTSVGLTDAQLRTPGVPSGTSLLWLIHHLTEVERHWFQFVFLGAGPRIDYEGPVPEGRTYDEVVAEYRSVCAHNDEIVRAHGLDTTAKGTNPGEDVIVSLRVITAHMVEETGRHAGHADILRELIDGRTGF
ncbi:DinB family protein [Kibdelosporangium lantanae]|uniref:DinB family protein n=1 Tax=Kibdelosporangium lantanae TaxID=1497396 RepID=A0ABW3MMW1_9PSEU